MLAVNAHYQGKFAEARGHLRLLHDIAVGNGMAQQEGWCSYITGELGNATGEFEAAEESGLRARELTEQLNDTLGIIIAEGVVAVARDRMGRHDEALAMADQCLEHIRGVLPTSWGAIEGYAGPVEVYLSAWERRLAAGTAPDELVAKTREALQRAADRFDALGAPWFAAQARG
jgi:hypothetical protein